MYLADEHKIWVCKGEDKICMLPKMANRHGLIAGATGTDVYKRQAGTVCTGTQSSEPSSGKQDQPAAGGRGWAGFLDKKSRTDA